MGSEVETKCNNALNYMVKIDFTSEMFGDIFEVLEALLLLLLFFMQRIFHCYVSLSAPIV